MSWNKILLTALGAGVMLSAALAETAIAQVPIRTGPSTTISRPPKQEPCWEVAGVSKSALQQRRALSRQARQEIEAVCTNSSLSIQQKRQQVQQIHQRERQEIDALITPSQQEAMQSCQEQRHGAHSGGGHGGGGHGGPCGEMPPGHRPTAPPKEDATPPHETVHPD